MNDFIKDWTDKEVVRVTKSQRRHSIFVFILKFILPVLAVILLAYMVISSNLEGEGEKISIEAGQGEAVKSNLPVMTNPRFHGLDADNQPYNIFAKAAIQDKEEKLHLEKINADITVSDGSWISMLADSGTYVRDDQMLSLFGEVNIFITAADFRGYEIDTTGARIDVENGLIVGDQPVQVRSDIGNFNASGFIANREEQKINFNGPIKMVIYR